MENKLGKRPTKYHFAIDLKELCITERAYLFRNQKDKLILPDK